MAENYTHHDSDNHGEHPQEHHIVGLPLYFKVFAILFLGTIITYYVALYDFDSILFSGANTLFALLIAFIKMICVVLFFMHVYWSSRLIWMTAIAGFFWLAIMFAFTMQDYLTRGSGVFTR